MKIPPFVRKILTQLMTEYFRYVLMATAFLVVVIGYSWFLQPQISSVREVGILALQQETAKLADRQAYLERQQRMVEAYRRVVSTQPGGIDDVLPTEAKVNDLFLTVQAIARESGMEVQSVSVTEGSSLIAETSAVSPTAPAGRNQASAAKVSGGSIKILDLTLVVRGPTDYESYKKLLRNVERSQRIFDVVNLDFRQQSSGDEASGEEARRVETITLELKAYYLEQPSTAK